MIFQDNFVSSVLTQDQLDRVQGTPYLRAVVDTVCARNMIAEAGALDRRLAKLLKKGSKYLRVRRSLAPNKGYRVYSWDAWEPAMPYACIDEDGDCEIAIEMRGVSYDDLAYAGGETSIRETYFASHG